VNLDLLEEVHEQARIKLKALKRKIELRQRTKVRPRQFQMADFVMQKAHPYQLENKLSPKMDTIVSCGGSAREWCIRLETLEGGLIPRTWIVANLKFYFS